MRDARLVGLGYYEVVTNLGTNNEVVETNVEHEVFMAKLWRAAFLLSKNDYQVAKRLVAKAINEVERFADATIGSTRFFAYSLEETVE